MIIYGHLEILCYGLLMFSPHICQGSWWLLAMPSAYQMTLQLDEDYRDQCRKMHYLVARQRELCTLSKNLLTVVSQGAQMGLKECQAQFSGRRWNCSTQFESDVPFLSDRNNKQLNDRFQSSHKSLSANYYNDYSNVEPDLTNKTVIASKPPEAVSKSQALLLSGYQSDQPMDDVADVFGRVLKYHSREKAYVHAISAAGVAYSITRACSKGELPSCSCDKNVHRRTKNKGQWDWGGCSEDLAYGERLSKDFVDSNEMSKTHDPSAKLMNLHNNEAGRRAIRSYMELMCKCHGVSGSCHKRHSKRDLVYLQESPDFCQENHKLGIYGTRSRKCNKSSYGTDGCSILCCGRGYTTKIVEKVHDCNCKFVWCCEVKCDKCRQKTEEYFCK